MTDSGWRKRQIFDEIHSCKGAGMSKRCKFKLGEFYCGSYAFNLYKDGIYQDDLCDVHYWQDQAQGTSMNRPLEQDYTSLVAYTRALEKFCDALAQPEQEPVPRHPQNSAFKELNHD